MRRLFLVLLTVVAVASLPGLASSQGFMPVGLPSLGGNGYSYYGYGNRVTVTGDIGYVCQSHATDISFVADGAALLNGLEWKQSFPVQGALAGSTVSFAPGRGMTFLVRGTWLFASGGESYETYRTNIPSAPERKWGTKPQWWTLEGAAAYSLNGSSAVIGGLRYDSFQVSFDNPGNAVGVASLPTDQADFQFSAWVPYIGVTAHHGGAKFGLVGSPWLPGSLKYGQTFSSIWRYDGSGAIKSGYLLEAFGEYATNLAGISAGLYAKWTLAHGTASIAVDGLGGVPFWQTADFSVTLDRQNWILGASASMSFYSPL